MKFFIPNPGDTVRVRLHTGEVVNAKYISQSPHSSKSHRIDAGIHNGRYEYLLASNKCRSISTCVFIGPSCDLVTS